MRFDPESNILCWEVAKGKVSHAVEIANFIIHVSASGKPIIIEMLEATKFLGQFDKIKNLKDVKRILPAN